MSLVVSQNRLNDAHAALLHTWHTVGERWRDDMRRRFDDETIEPTERAIRSAQAAMETMNESLLAARTECA